MGRVFYTDLPPNLRFCLVALADHANDDGRGIYVGQTRLARKLGVSDRSVRSQLAELREAGWIERTKKAKGPGRGGAAGSPDHYRLVIEKLPSTDEIDALAETPEESSALSDEETPEASIQKTGSPLPKHRKPTSREPSVEPSVQPSALAAVAASEPTIAQRSNALAKGYYDVQPLCNFPSISKIARKAIRAGHSDEAIREALLRLADERRGVTTETLRVELEGLPERKSRQVDRAAEILKGAMADG